MVGLQFRLPFSCIFLVLLHTLILFCGSAFCVRLTCLRFTVPVCADCVWFLRLRCSRYTFSVCWFGWVGRCSIPRYLLFAGFPLPSIILPRVCNTPCTPHLRVCTRSHSLVTFFVVTVALFAHLFYHWLPVLVLCILFCAVYVYV